MSPCLLRSIPVGAVSFLVFEIAQERLFQKKEEIVDTVEEQDKYVNYEC